MSQFHLGIIREISELTQLKFFRHGAGSGIASSLDLGIMIPARTHSIAFPILKCVIIILFNFFSFFFFGVLVLCRF